MFVKFNTLRPPFQGNPKLWQALNYAIDKKLIIDSLWSGMGAVANCQPLSPAYFGYNPDLKPYPYDPAKAKALLAAAGYPDGLDLELETTIGRYIQATDIAQIVAAQMAEIGVRARHSELEFGRRLHKIGTATSMVRVVTYL